jgi:dolichol kinase
MALSREEIRRKMLHFFALIMPLAIFYAPQLSMPKYMVAVVLFVFFSLSVTVELLRFKVPLIQKMVLKLFGSMMRKEEHAVISGWTWVIGAAFLCSVLFRKNPRIALIALSLFIIGDAVAALVGIGVGRIRIGKKTLEGSIACLFVCLLMFYTVFPFVPGLMSDTGLKRFPDSIIWITSIVITFFELIPLRINKKIIINDNLAVPIIAGYTLIVVEKIFIK